MMKHLPLTLNHIIISCLVVALLLLLAGCTSGEPPQGEATGVAATPQPTFTAVPATPSPEATLTATAPPPTPEPSPVTPTATALAGVRQGDTLSLPSPTPLRGIACLVASAELPLREGPAATYPVIGTLSSGSSLSALKYAEDSAWVLAETAQQEIGWVDGDSVNCQEDLATLPVAMGIPAQPAALPDIPATRPPLPTATPLPPPPTDTPTPTPPAGPPTGRWRGEYYDNASLLGQPVLVREDATIDFNWFLDSPGPGIPADNFSVRWTGIFEFSQAGDYRFFAGVDDGVRLYLDGWLVIDAWGEFQPIDYFGTFEDVQAGLHTIVVEYVESGGHARAKVWYEHGNFADEDWIGEYYDNRNLGDPVIFTQGTDEIDFDWDDDSPDGRLSDDRFSVRWRRTVHLEHGDYRFFADLEDEDEVRVTIDGWEVMNDHRDSQGRVEGRFDNLGGGNHTMVVEFREHGDDAAIEFWWERED